MRRNWTREERARRELLVRVGLAGIALLAVYGGYVAVTCCA